MNCKNLGDYRPCSTCKKMLLLSMYSRKYKSRNLLMGICRDCHREAKKQEHRNLKILALTHYGFECRCCGEANQLFLSIDHINNDGAKHRKTCTSFYRWLKRNSYPTQFQTLCYNCNHGKYLNGGICPHGINVTQTPRQSFRCYS